MAMDRVNPQTGFVDLSLIQVREMVYDAFVAGVKYRLRSDRRLREKNKRARAK